jgi:hypothetical protein
MNLVTIAVALFRRWTRSVGNSGSLPARVTAPGQRGSVLLSAAEGGLAILSSTRLVLTVIAS